MTDAGPAQAIEVPCSALIVLFGPAGSGKSRFAARQFRPTQVVSSDACRAMVCDDETNQHVSGRAFDLFHRIVEHRLALGRLTVADSTALSPRARRDLRRLARRHQREIVVLAFDFGLQWCLAHNVKRERSVPLGVVALQRQKFREELPKLLREGYAAIHRLTPRTVDLVEIRVRPRHPPPALPAPGALRGEPIGTETRRSD